MKKTIIRRDRRATPVAKEENPPAQEERIDADVAPEEEVVLTATKQLTLRCGDSSITLTAAGTIILRGKYIVSRSSGVQRIKGGSVQIN